jgi:uncharacterized OB-fold protein
MTIEGAGIRDTDADQARQESVALQIRQREVAIRVRYEEHRRTWGDGVPYFSDGTFEFWRELSAGRFNIGRCTQCSHTYFPPRIVCPNCWAQDAVKLLPSQGTGTIHSYAVAHRVANSLQSLAPLLMATVDLEEGVRLFTWLRGATGDPALIGKRCRIVIETILGRPRFVARLLDGS